MKLTEENLRLSSRDLTGYLNCRHLTQLELQVVRGALKRPKPWDPSLEALWERGSRHEREFVDHLASESARVIVIDGIDVDDAAVERTLAAMAEGAEVIVQAALRSGDWVGRADVLRRVDAPSVLGPWSYEAWDTKLSRDTKAATILQLCLYSEILGEMQGGAPEHMHVVAPWADFVPQTYRVAEYAAYYRRVRNGFAATLASAPAPDTYPHPTAHCDICAWRGECDARRRADDHLSLVAGISSLQMAELNANGVGTVAALAALPLPLPWQPQRGSRQGFERVREQARLQVESREAGELRFETLPVEPGFGLAALPEPSRGDIYLDFEGDSFVGEHGQEYLLGYSYLGDDGGLRYTALWGLARSDEKAAFEAFIDFVIAQWEAHPHLHIYHYGAYEVAALKRLMGRYATREEELDRILRGRVMVDLLSVVRHAIRAGVESYSIKRLEPLYGFKRRTDLPDANLALTRLQTALELGDLADIGAEEMATVQSYNEDDCVSTRHLHLWLEQLRAVAIAGGAQIDRPAPGDGSPSENVAEWLARITPLIEALTADVPVDAVERTAEQQGRWLLAHMLDFHRREDKANWWEYFRLADLDAEELVEEKSGLSGLTLQATVGGTAKCPIHRYVFPPQETDLRPGKKLRNQGGAALGAVEAISVEGRTIDI
jgi:predicted RecB family nuclease